MCREEISRAHSALVGTAIRLAECMGLHRDPLEYDYGPVETHIRRLIWYQLCFLDLRTAETQGPRITIRREDFSTKIPLNINDADLAAGQKEESKEWTDMTFACLRFESQEILREAFVDRLHLEQRNISVTGAISKIETGRRKMYEKYSPIFNRQDLTPLQRTASITMSFMLHRLYIVLLHKFYNSFVTKMPDRLVQLIISTGTQQLEDAVTLETTPELRPWVWYSRAYHNFHTAFLLLLDVSAHPLRREADRIWRCLDYVYEIKDNYPSHNLTRAQIIEHRRKKSHMILSQFRDRMMVYRALRRIKTSTDIQEISVLDSTSSSPKPSSQVMTETETLPNFKIEEPVTLLPNLHAQNKARAIISQPHHSQVPVPDNTHPQFNAKNYVPATSNRGLSQFVPALTSVFGNTAGVEGLQSSWLPMTSDFSFQTASQGSNFRFSPSVSEDLSIPEVDWVCLILISPSSLLFHAIIRPHYAKY